MDLTVSWISFRPVVWFFGKTCLGNLPDHVVQMDIPRLRIDQILTLEWKYLLPINLVNTILIAFIVLMGWYFK